MTDHVVRLYALAPAILAFFLSFALVAARPRAGEPTAGVAAASSPELAALSARERTLQERIATARELLGAAAVEQALPAVQVVSTPPATVTRSS
jgi:hypothetical protein